MDPDQEQGEQQNAATGEPAPGRAGLAGFMVAGIGASAGGVAAIEQFFAHLPAGNPDMAFVVVTHLSPEHESNLAEIIGHHTSLPVLQVNESTLVRPNHVYVIPPGKQLAMVDGHIRLSDPVAPRGRRAPIDIFFRTLAESHDGRAAAIVLSGTGSDGASGLARVKEMGGVTLAQDPAEAQHNGMPRSAIDTGMVDIVDSVTQLGQRLIHYRDNGYRLELPALPEEQSPSDASQTPGEFAPPAAPPTLYEVIALLRTRTGHNFAQYKQATLTRRVARRMQVNDTPTLQAYLDFLSADPDEVQALLRDLLISVTNFFRDPESWDALQIEVIPNLFRNKDRPEAQVRVWVAGCATGEEAYTVAMLLHEQAAKLGYPPRLQVFATDLDDHAIAVARDGAYPETIEADVSPERLRRFFTRDGRRYRVSKELRETVLFSTHNVLKDPPFSRLDLVSCRNLLIYLNREAQEQALLLFHFALNPDGFLLLGASESADNLPQLYNNIDKKHRIYSRRTLPRYAQPLPTLQPRVGQPTGRSLPDPTPALSRERTVTAGELHQNLLERYAPPSVIVDQNFEIVHLSNNAGRYLQFAGGEPSHNLLQSAHPDLRLDLRKALYAASGRGIANETRRILMRLNGSDVFVRVVVRPVQEPQSLRGYMLVLFDEIAYSAAGAGDAESAPDDDARPDYALVRQLEEEVGVLRGQLRATIEQYETSVEELKSSNEELQAINEELRSATEELETSKEEMQAVNEELLAVNQELKIKMDEVGRANSDLQNLMLSTDIATLFLDRQMQVKRYTPAAERLFNIIPTDMGRPISHLTHRLRYDSLAADAVAVLRDLRPLTREVETSDGDWYLMRLLPYRTLEDRIEGVVITFVDITERRRAEQALRSSEEKYRSLFDSIDEGFGIIELLCDAAGNATDYRFLEVNQPYERQTGQLNPLGKLGSTLPPYTEHYWLDRYDLVARTGEAMRFEDFHEANGRWYSTYASRIGGAGSRQVALVFDDITERKRAEEVLRQREERQAFLLKFSDGLRSLADPLVIQEAAMSMVGEQLNVNRAYYTEVLPPDGDTLSTGPAYLNAAPALAGPMKISELDPDLLRQYLAGRTVVSDDLAADLHSTEQGSAPLEETRFRASISVPLLNDGRLLAIVTVDQSAPRKWRAEEIALLEEVAERTWAAVERSRSEKALRESEQNLRGVANIAPDLLWHGSADGSTNWYNQRWLEYTGQAFEAAVGWGWTDAVHPEDREAATRRYRETVEKGQALQQEYRIRRHDGVYRWFLARAEPLHGANGNVMQMYGAATDIHEQRTALDVLEERVRARTAELIEANEELQRQVAAREEAEQGLRESNVQLRTMSSRVLEVQEEERRSISRELHDEVGQYLTGLRLLLESFNSSGIQAAPLQDALDAVTNLTERVRALSLDLRPTMLDDLGLLSALLWQIEQYRSRTGITVTLRHQGLDRRLRGEVETAIYRIVQEALTNVARHADVKEVTVQIMVDSYIPVLIEDEGNGFDVAAALARHDSSGVSGMQERTELLGGVFTIESTPGSGTRIIAEIPLEAVEE